MLSTLSEQKSIESDTNIPFLDGPLSEDSRGSRAPDDVTGNGGGGDCDDDEGVGAVGVVSTTCSKTDPSGIPTLESLTDFHVDCDSTRLTYS